MEHRKILFIEGATNSPNGDLRAGFEKLLSKKLNKLPKIKLAGGKSITINLFLKNNFAGEALVLIDLDNNEENRNKDLHTYSLYNHKANVFYMIQEMESWFLSQPEVLDSFFGASTTGKKVSERMSKKHPSAIEKPKEELKRITQTLNKREQYQSIKHAERLLELLDAAKLETDFPDFKRLIEKLK